MTLASGLGRLAGALRGRPRTVSAIAILLALTLAAWITWTASMSAELLRDDPDLVALRPRLVQYALPRGRDAFQAHCAECHGSDGRGDSARGVPDLTDHDWLYGSGQVSDIETVIQYGIRAPNPKTWKLARMPAYARPIPYPPEPTMKPLSPDDIRDVVAFLTTVEGRTPASDASSRGGAIFVGRGGCYDCHGPDAHGDPGVGAPNLTDAIWLYGSGRPDEIFQTIAYGRAGVCPAWITRLRPVVIREIAVFIHALSTGATKPKGGRL
jgi:cytochrome c oxidase cbb3-type subunit 3